MKSPKLLITGANGVIGRILWRHLTDSFELYGFDVCVNESSPRIFRADVSNYEQVVSVLQEIAPISCIIHLAGDPRPEADWQSVLMNNIVGTRNIYEAAKTYGIKRVIFASSNHVTVAYEGFPPSLHSRPNSITISVHDPIRPDGCYGVSKAFGEAIARMYYELYSVESICLRIGVVDKDDNPTLSDREQSLWLSNKDLVQLIKKSIFSDVGFGIYYGVSNNKNKFYDISNAGEEIGYQPEDDATAL
jgi:nucleoside-diphosphate-sugar epimerase